MQLKEKRYATKKKERNNLKGKITSKVIIVATYTARRKLLNAYI